MEFCKCTKTDCRIWDPEGPNFDYEYFPKHCLQSFKIYEFYVMYELSCTRQTMRMNSYENPAPVGIENAIVQPIAKLRHE